MGDDAARARSTISRMPEWGSLVAVFVTSGTAFLSA
jgi:hypothetical protein